MLAYRPMDRPLALLLTVALASATAVAAGNPAADKFAVTLEPGKIHEVCTPIADGEKRRYHWKADAPVDFNIHYHQGPEVFYPVKRDAMRGDGGTFAARSAQEYCWMWTARTATTRIEGSVQPK